ncbi:MAG: DUF349 domain-containing protein [Erysipelotrichaceae bacterium]|nr:DUF349 domain-containing protein [Erysipelotrichaceae bacterium]
MNIDEQLQKKKELVAKAKELSEQEDVASAVREAMTLSRKWRYSEEESFSEKELREEFEKYMDVVLAKKDEVFGNVEDYKKDIIGKAKEVLDMKNFKEATAKMNELMNSWKQAGHVNKETDDALWEEFNGVRQEFYANREKAYAEFKEKSATAKQVKEDIIARANELATSTEYKKTTEKFAELLEEWKAAGRTTDKAVDDALWEQFSAARKAFNNAKDEYYGKLKETFKANAVSKQELIAKAKEIVENAQFSKEITESVKGLREEWKKVGSAGREKEENLWKEFNETVNQYFDGLKKAGEEKHEQWIARMEDNIEYKKSLIEKAKRDIAYQEKVMSEALGESAIEDAKEVIADKEDFIAKLEADIEDITKKIAE